MNTTERLETLSSLAATHLERAGLAITVSSAADISQDLSQAEPAIVGMRHILEAHPEVDGADSWWVIHNSYDEDLTTYRSQSNPWIPR